ncbi:MAG: tRNA (adenosine(37)-N6)-dimethylallyltransferase MiaA [Actinomycetota bacterium]|nr:tRNA (adenosine(37)-N6)-dimethylallyltransferase MiaA [Actinomycetota bacterium]
MNSGPSTVKVAALLGPTAVGKSRIAVDLATRLGAEIISVDSMQLYIGMDIGTDKPTARMRGRVHHHMIDILDPSSTYSVAEFQTQARTTIERLAAAGMLPFLVGGTGLYFEAVVFDLVFPPGGSDEKLRRELEEWASEDPEGIKERLREVDPGFAARDDFANLRRVVRALEVYELTGMPMSKRQRKGGCQEKVYPYAGAVLSAPRHLLYKAIDDRVDRMFERGLVREVEELVSLGGISRTARQALGYKEVLGYLDSRYTLDETIYDVKKRSRRYAKRQLTWLRRIPGLRWFELEEEELYGDTWALLGKLGDYLAEELQAIS